MDPKKNNLYIELAQSLEKPKQEPSAWGLKSGVNQDKANELAVGMQKSAANPEWVNNIYHLLLGK